MYIYFLIAFATFAIWWYRKRKYQMSLFQRLNIPGPEPHLITGNLGELQKKGIAECQTLWTKKYGNILGYYLGGNPILMVSDTELIKYVEVKNFQDFLDRPVFPANLGIVDHRIFDGISLAPGEARWKEMRSLLSPGFTAKKMKQMTEPVNRACRILSEEIKEKIRKDEALDIEKMFDILMMDVVERTILGIQTERDDNSLYQRSVKKFTCSDSSNFFIFTKLCLPELEPIIDYFEQLADVLRTFLGLPSIRRVFDHVIEIIKMRRRREITRPDLLQAMVDANMTEEQLQSITGKQLVASLEKEDEDIVKDTTSPTSRVHYMTDDEVVGNAVTLLLAGHDTTSTTLQFVIRLLARYPDEQEKLREEINSVLEGEEPDYNAVTKMDYMQQVISEALRLYPIVLMFIFRRAARSFSYKNFNIPAGLTVQPAIWPMHRDPELWKEADKFDPDRFSPTRKSTINTYAYQPFGLGPRNCVGMRFAFTMMKLVLAHLLHSFKFVENGKTNEGDLKVQFAIINVKPANDTKIKAVAI